MTQPRLIARDASSDAGAPVVAAHRVFDGAVTACRTPVTHSYAALAFYTGGSSRMALRGDWKLQAGDLLLVPAGEPHRMVEGSRPELWGLSFCVPCFASSADASLLEPFERIRAGASPVVRVPTARHEYLASLFRELENIGSTTSERLDAIARSLLTLILAEAEKGFVADAPRAPAGVAAQALRFIERNCLRPLTLADVAEAVRRSPAHVTTALTQATGKSAVQWIVSGRMGEARRLLLHSDEMVDVVAERVGYADATHFIRMFRREHGATPAAWRAARRHV